MTHLFDVSKMEEQCKSDLNPSIKNNPKYLQTLFDLEKQKKIIKSVNISKLPDKGAKIKSRIEELESALESLNISQKVGETSSSSSQLKKKEKSHSNDEKKLPTGKEGTSKEESCDSGFNEGKIPSKSNEALTFTKVLTSDAKCSGKLSKIAPVEKSNESFDVKAHVNQRPQTISKGIDETSSKSAEGKGHRDVKSFGKLSIKAPKDDSNVSFDVNPQDFKRPSTILKENGTSSSSAEGKEKSHKNDDKKFQIINDCISNDSGFSDSKIPLYSNKGLTFGEALTSADVKSFSELSRKAPKDGSNISIDISSPAFKSYRRTEEIPSIKLTEAKPLFEKVNKKNPYKTAFSPVYMNSLADEETVKQLHDCLVIFPDDTKEESSPKYLKTSLMRHQIEALTWLMWREAQVPSGGILADDMGLGKTLTMISLILKQRERENYSDYSEEKSVDAISKGTLIICVASIIHQWEEECLKHTKQHSLNILLYHGPKRDKDIEFMRRHDVVLTTYSTLMSERKSFEKGKECGLFQLKWERIILDEAHTIKNHSSQTAQAVFSLRGFKKWCMTGTPIHNDFKDMYSLIKFLKFYPFDDYKKFKKLTDNDTKACVDRRNMLVKSILLRRTKQELDKSGKPLVEMKQKSTIICKIELSEEERKAYEEIDRKVSEVVNKFFQNDSKKVGKSSSLLVLLLRLQQCCCHPSLLSQKIEEENDSLCDISLQLETLSIAENSKNASSCDLDCTFSGVEKYDIYSRERKSSKIKKLFDELNKISVDSSNTAKSVIVSQWVTMLDLVAFHLDKDSIPYHKIDGSVKVAERQQMSEDFNYNHDGCKVMLLSLKAGGVGLNLIGASHLFLLDLHWNPALEMQACDRIHRVGQKNDVFIHKFVCKETIEERILDLQKQKSSIASDVLFGAAAVRQRLSIEDFKMLFNLRM